MKEKTQKTALVLNLIFLTILFSGQLLVEGKSLSSSEEALVVTIVPTVMPRDDENSEVVEDSEESETEVTTQNLNIVPPDIEEEDEEEKLAISGFFQRSDLNNNIQQKKDKKPEKMEKPQKPEIYSFKINSDIKYRYSRTCIVSRVVNPDLKKSQEVTFRTILPESAFISKFIMEIDGKTYEAYVKPKEEAKKAYTEAQEQGQSAGLVELNARHSNVFNVNVNVKAQSKVTFNLTYEELLSRRLGRYEHIINISPEHINQVKDFEIKVNIEESKNISKLFVPKVKNDEEEGEVGQHQEENKNAVIERPSGNKAEIKWTPSKEDQEQMSKEGVSGKFIVHYDIDREDNAGEILVMNGYFVHFFAPSYLQPLRKHVVFILDISGSMWGRKIEQLRTAMTRILGDLKSEDFFNILTFSSNVKLWSPLDKVKDAANSNWNSQFFGHEGMTSSPVDEVDKNQPYPANKENIEKAQKFIETLAAIGGTNIHDAVVSALNLTKIIKSDRDKSNNAVDGEETTIVPKAENSKVSTAKNILPKNVESLIIFLTDGEPTDGITNQAQIQSFVQAANKNLSVPIFSLAFGKGADFPFVRKLSLQNNGFARKIYEASDADLQLRDFYKEIASPLLSNVTFNYTSPEYKVSNLTVSTFSTFFGGTEIAIAGLLTPTSAPSVISPSDISLEGSGDSDSVVTEYSVAEEQTTTSYSAPAVVEEEGVTEITFDAPIAPELFSAAEDFQLEVTIQGNGREGEVIYEQPDFLSSFIPFSSLPISSPFPPRPTPIPTQEDIFLEKLWAYLTIKQLINKDIASIDKENMVDNEIKTTTASSIKSTASGTTIVNCNSETSTNCISIANVTKPETPKEQALRLALKYGFVTSLTSLVVVKPNSTESTANTVSTDGDDSKLSKFQAMPLYAAHPVAQNSMQAYVVAHPQSISLAQNNFAPNRINFNKIGNPRPVGFITGGGGGSTYGSQSAQQSYGASYGAGSGLYSFNKAITRPRPTFAAPFYPPSTPSLAYRPTTNLLGVDYIDSESLGPEEEEEKQQPSSGETYKLTDIKWLNSTTTTIPIGSQGNIVNYNVANNSSVNVEGVGKICHREMYEGSCLHLMDCIKSEFLDDFEKYKEFYFCPLGSSGDYFAGSCC